MSKDPPAEPEAFGCWPLKGALSQPLKSKSNCNDRRVAKQWASSKQKQQQEAYSRNSQSSTATPAEPGDLPFDESQPSLIYLISNRRADQFILIAI
jgi:hypothetical protein